ncbi:PAP2-domain-containing protein [Yamadazyma tenuis]|uniref:Phosphatidic acid phosphatase type 2/haloperoxidase domain-containing protein n=1 Tax=Candida tenuis (strain ATCC 10573 / BCRC 21748 / CBS 615 / JCM 9827 / NBRC 10315 / NRRL Y-1498 / VKM Y-70) TaxID=590646 RepID=G3B7W6_CANTC|nr:uncharacterized protein CANTEDRAFT_108486 [Yamadazyma tenuis ATCC 10573]EGV61675.1 hypothetical protein CANTEDRAFT_108486 [Yamadazyma tenuis ATCC 10573]WEJ92900.1 PAP2-domain-containing protein [Yamadazyma tenuis]
MHIDWNDSTYTVYSYTISSLSFYSYVFDWLFYLLILSTSVIYGRFAPPRFHEFSFQDITLMNTYKTEAESAVPLWLLVIIGFGLPLLQFIFCSILGRHTFTLTRRLWDIHSGMLVLTGSLACQLMVTCILKNICGLPRPDLLSRCEPAANAVLEPFTLANVNDCTTDSTELLWEGFRSFPSGHSSTVFCGMVISSLNIAAKLQVFDKRGLSIKVVLAILPLMVACFVSCSRISDNRHFLRDIIGGSIIGSCIGTWFYLQYFPSIFNLENGGRAYPPRRLGVAKFFNNVGGFWKIGDELPGAYNERILNDPKVFPSVSQLGTINRDDTVDMSRNIDFFNSLRKRIPSNFNQSQSSSTPLQHV